MYFTSKEFKNKYTDYDNREIKEYEIDSVCEMIFSRVGLIYRREWNEKTVPLPIKKASMEQLRFMYEHDIPFVDFDKSLTAGPMKADLKSDYSTLSLRILANYGYLYRGSPIDYNISMNLPFGGST